MKRNIQEVKLYKPPFWKTWKFWKYAILVIVILFILFIFKIIIFGNITERGDWTVVNIIFTLNDPNASWGFSFANGLLLGAYIGILISSTYTPKVVAILIIVFVIIFAFFGIGLGIEVWIYSAALNPQVFATNTVEGIDFIVGNIFVLTLVFFASLLAESEAKEK